MRDDDDFVAAIRKNNARIYEVPPEYLSRAERGVEQLLQHLQLSQGDEQPLTGNRPITQNTTKNYEKQYRGK